MQLKSFVIMVGPPRSGTTLIKHLLDAHPRISMSNEIDILGMIQSNPSLSLRELVRRIVENSSRQTETIYPLPLVPGQWNGRAGKDLEVVGDKKAGKTACMVADDDSLIRRLVSILGNVPLRILIPVRNPVDNICSMATRTEISPAQDACEWACSLYASMVAGMDRTLELADKGGYSCLVVRYEDMLRDTASGLATIHEFVNTTPPLPCDYVKACCSVVKQDIRSRRDLVKWTPRAKDRLASIIRSTKLLEGYSLDL